MKQLQKPKFEKVKRLIEQHWLEGLPLWDFLTGLREWQGTRSSNPIEITAHRCFWKWMYRIRQVVALHRIERMTWRDLSIAYLRRQEQIYHDEAQGKAWETFEEADIVESVIDMLSNAIEFRLGFKGNRGYGGEDFVREGYFSVKGRIANETEHAIVHLVNQYCERVNKTLREELGSFYVQWEESEDQRVIPKDILL
jgi:hypothetical protein